MYMKCVVFHYYYFLYWLNHKCFGYFRCISSLSFLFVFGIVVFNVDPSFQYIHAEDCVHLLNSIYIFSKAQNSNSVIPQCSHQFCSMISHFSWQSLQQFCVDFCLENIFVNQVQNISLLICCKQSYLIITYLNVRCIRRFLFTSF